ncbi:MAG: A/G-specific adenine glycosylase [Oceanicoccus sp.]
MTSKPKHRLKHAEMDISKRVLDWFEHSGRKDLPWQKGINPYRVWVSEIMLQQTQVSTVIPYFQKFMLEFPNIDALAAASDDQVMHLWTGLGYYSRARNLHKTAKIICQQHLGNFPDTVDGLVELPGIGRSTAGAIVSIAHQKPAAILDGNVKRVLARYQAIEGWPGKTTVLRELWQLAETLTPSVQVADYSQAMMDLGATICTRSKPICTRCPLNHDCIARQQGNTGDYPGKKPKKIMPVKPTRMLLIRNHDNEVLLEKRPPSGIWGGLWAFPQLDTDSDIGQYCFDNYGLKTSKVEHWQTYRHTFSHYHLDISPTVILLQQANQPSMRIMEANRMLWYNTLQPPKIGLAAPIKKLIDRLPISDQT